MVRSMALTRGLDTGVKKHPDLWIKNLAYGGATSHDRKPKKENLCKGWSKELYLEATLFEGKFKMTC